MRKLRHGIDSFVSETSSFTHKSASCGDFQPLKLTSTLQYRLSYLMTVLENSGALGVEGIFRKTGSLTQQRAVVDALLHQDFNCTTFPWHEYSAHELAGALKSMISHLDQPLLTSGLIPFYLQAAKKKRKKNLITMEDSNKMGIYADFDTFKRSIKG
ncbi:unnamed protein product [Hymenolepis diminuta]|uniref:Rho-GAP domain-containing protein n=1 Tax=Hymenolepis diminuta TaxID=6216 RepID=A0A0R3SDC6_HYMDI|nr:unnamed protein product [Hymenolepis diminuta]